MAGYRPSEPMVGPDFDRRRRLGSSVVDPRSCSNRQSGLTLPPISALGLDYRPGDGQSPASLSNSGRTEATPCSLGASCPVGIHVRSSPATSAPFAFRSPALVGLQPRRLFHQWRIGPPIRRIRLLPLSSHARRRGVLQPQRRRSIPSRIRRRPLPTSLARRSRSQRPRVLRRQQRRGFRAAQPFFPQVVRRRPRQGRRRAQSSRRGGDAPGRRE